MHHLGSSRKSNIAMWQTFMPDLSIAWRGRWKHSWLYHEGHTPARSLWTFFVHSILSWLYSNLSKLGFSIQVRCTLLLNGMYKFPLKRIKETTLTCILFSPQLKHMISTSSSYQTNMIKHISSNHWSGFYPPNSPTQKVVVVEENTGLALASQVRQKWTEATAKSPKQGHAPWWSKPFWHSVEYWFVYRDPKSWLITLRIYVYIHDVCIW